MNSAQARSIQASDIPSPRANARSASESIAPATMRVPLARVFPSFFLPSSEVSFLRKEERSQDGIVASGTLSGTFVARGATSFAFAPPLLAFDFARVFVLRARSYSRMISSLSGTTAANVRDNSRTRTAGMAASSEQPAARICSSRSVIGVSLIRFHASRFRPSRPCRYCSRGRALGDC